MQFSKRIQWVDVTKCIGIYLVILGHSGLSGSPHDYVYAFHMPLFFFMSGFLFKFGKYPDLKTFLKVKWQQIIIPYIFFSIITYIFWVFIGRKFGADSSINIHPLLPLLGTLYGNGIGYYFIHAAALWFLPCLFSVELMFYLCYKRSKTFYSSLVITGILLGIGITGLLLKHPRLPWSIDVAFFAVIFYWFGYLFQKKYERLQDNLRSLLFATILIVIVFFTIPLNGRVDMSSNVYNNIALYIFNATACILAIVAITKFLDNANLPLTSYLGQNTIIILAFHSIILSLLKGILFYGLNIHPSLFTKGLVANMGISLFALLVCLLPIYLINRYFPYFIGRDKKKRL